MNLEFNQSNQSQEETSELSDFGNQFLTNVPDEDKPVLQKYIKEWDGNVTRKFQEYADKNRQYEELGDVSELTNAYQVLNDLRSDPVGFFEYFRDYLTENHEAISETYGVEDLAQRLGISMDEMNQQPPQNAGMEGIPQPVAEMIGQLQNELREARDEVNNLSTSQKEREQMAMLDSTLEKLHTDHGDFDDTFVLTQIAGGKTPEQAIEAYSNLKQSIIDSHSKTPPPNLLTGPSGTPLDQVDVTKLKDAKTRKSLGAALLERSNQSN